MIKYNNKLIWKENVFVSKKSDNLDSFWDISSLIPTNHAYRKSQSISLDEIDTSADKGGLATKASSSTVIEKEIPTKNRLSFSEQKYEKTIEYSPNNSLIHNVILKKKISSLDYYEDFIKYANKYIDVTVDKADYVSFFSYVPQYDQLDRAQLKYYLYWRTKIRNGVFENTDYSYVLLYIFELINTANENNALENQYMLTEIWNRYHELFPMLSDKLISWICDFSLIHRLSPPINLSSKMVSAARSLKEFFISVPDNDYSMCADWLMKYCTSYDYKTSKFAVKENSELYDKHIKGALRCAVELLSENGKILSKLSNEDSQLVRDSFAGALCSSLNRYTIEVKYCSFSRSNELRYLVGDIIKYSENKIRAYIGVKSKLTVYSLSTEIRAGIDFYFDNNLSGRRAQKKQEEKHDYDVLYDVPVTPLSLDNALKIEERSWDVTNDLVSAFSEEATEEFVAPEIPQMESENDGVCNASLDENDLISALGQFLEFVKFVLEYNKEGIESFVIKSGKLLDSIVDEVNEISVEVIGDILIEDIGDGTLEIVEYYRDMIK